MMITGYQRYIDPIKQMPKKQTGFLLLLKKTNMDKALPKMQFGFIQIVKPF